MDSFLPFQSEVSTGNDASDAFDYPAALPTDTTSTYGRPVEPNKQTTFIRSLTDFERLDMVLQDLRNKHKWSIKTFLCHLVTAQPERRSNQHGPDVRTQRLAEAILQPDVLSRLLKVSDEIHEIGTSGLVDRLRSEIWHICAADIGLGEFDKDAQIQDLDIPTMADNVQQGAPELCCLLRRLMDPYYHGVKNHTPTKGHKGPITMICAILAYAASPRKANNFPTMLSMYAHSMGVQFLPFICMVFDTYLVCFLKLFRLM